MKTNKEQILDLIRLHFSTGSGASTQYVADALGIKRSNASALLNELVEEGLLEKSGGRPVLYGVKASEAKDYECFDSLVGKDGSLARATKLIKAAAQYPGKSLNVFITGDKGTGKSLLAYVAHQFSLESGVLLPDALYRTLDCRDYEGDERKAESALFGDGASGGLFAGMRRGFLVVDNAHLLNSRLRGMLCDAAESDDDGSYPAVAVIAESGAHEAATEFRRRLPITIELPTLAERPFEERLELVQRFFTLEAARAGRDIAISAELLRCLLLYDCEFNVSQLKGDIKIACANAYVRDIASKGGSIEVVIGDFDNYVRKGFLNYRKHRDEIERLIDPDYSYSFSSVSMKMSPIDRDKLRYSQNIYSDLNRRAGELRAHGLGEKDISLLLETELEANFNTYRAQLARRVINSEQLSKLVDERIIELVEEFLASASEKFGESYPASVHYGLCLHIDSALKKTQRTQALTPAQISDIVEKHKEKYLLSFRFAAKLEKAFSVELPTDEVVLIAMFICFDAPYANAAGSPSLLLVFHGAGIATALAASVNTVTGLGNVSALDIPYGLTTE